MSLTLGKTLSNPDVSIAQDGVEYTVGKAERRLLDYISALELSPSERRGLVARIRQYREICEQLTVVTCGEMLDHCKNEVFDLLGTYEISADDERED